MSTEIEKAFEEKDTEAITKLIKLCKRIETTKDSITKSSLNKTLFRVEKAWRSSDVGVHYACSREMRKLIAAWKEKYFKKVKETEKSGKADKKAVKIAARVPSTGVKIRDSMRTKFHEILLE